MDTNSFGLTRRIPNGVKRAVRQTCGYGCVACGCAIYEYDHVDPPFEEAREHDPRRIALLCGACHAKKTRGLLSTQTVMAALASPASKREGFSRVALDVGPDTLVAVQVGATSFKGMKNILIIDEEPVLSVLPPESRGLPPRINAVFYDRSNSLVATIVENEWRGEVSAFDIETVGSRITVRSQLREIDLSIEVVPPRGIVIHRLRMHRNGKSIVGSTQSGFEFKTMEAAVVIPPQPETVGRALYWVSIQDKEVRLGTGAVLRGVRIEQEDPEVVGIPPPPGAEPGHKVIRITKLSPKGKPAALNLSTLWKAPNGKLVPVQADGTCPCGSGKRFQDCHMPPGFFER